MAEGTCVIEGCDRPVRCKQLCSSHYAKRPRRACGVNGCTDPILAHDLCSAHYQQQRKTAGPTCTVVGCEQAQWTRGGEEQAAG